MEGIKLIAERRGIGDLLAEGSLRAARWVGQGSEAWAMQVKGLEMPGYEPRSLKTMALGLAVSTVSRAVAGKYVQTPRGIFPLRICFQASAGSGPGVGPGVGVAPAGLRAAGREGAGWW